MASYRGHLITSTALGIAYGTAGLWYHTIDPFPAVLAAGLTSVSGLLPDLDSDSGVPVRALFALASVVFPLLVLPRLLAMHYSLEGVLLILIGSHLLIRYGLSVWFKSLTVHRGMFHSIPAALIAGLLVFLLYHHRDDTVRLFLAGGAVIGFLSHLVLDELCSVDLTGVKPKLNRYAGSALKLASPSWGATIATYALLFCLAFLAMVQAQGLSEADRATHTLSIRPSNGR